jgi:hypothetical protein
MANTRTIEAKANIAAKDKGFDAVFEDIVCGPDLTRSAASEPVCGDSVAVGAETIGVAIAFA